MRILWLCMAVIFIAQYFVFDKAIKKLESKGSNETKEIEAIKRYKKGKTAAIIISAGCILCLAFSFFGY